LSPATAPATTAFRGTSGSGKTVVLLHRALRLAKASPSADVRVFTINRSLAELLRANLLSIHGTLLENLHVEAFYDFLHRCVALFDRADRYRLVDDRSGERIGVSWGDFYRHRTNVFSEPEARKLVASVEGRAAARVDATKYLREEMVYIRSMFRRQDREQYLTAPRSGRSIQLQAQQRETCLKILAAWEEWLEAGELCDIDGLTVWAADFFYDVTALGRIRAEFPTDHVLVDEVQDFSTLELSLVRRLVPETEASNAFFFVGDLQQKVYPKHHSGTLAGFNFQNWAAVMRKNHRNTRQILQAAYRIIAEYPPQSDEAVEVLAPELSPFEGDRPVVVRVDPAGHVEQILAAIEQRAGCRVAVVSENEQLLAWVRAAATRKGYKCHELFRNEDLDRWRRQEGDALATSVVLSRLEAVKGFEFDAVVACDLSEGVTPRPGTPPEELWREAATVYCALTRARDELIITYSGSPSVFLECMRPDVTWTEQTKVFEALSGWDRPS
jgi:superfamily I DNA/RNA helicase